MTNMRSHLDYGDIIYHQSNNRSYFQKIESIQYKVALGITSAIHETSQTKLYNELTQYLNKLMLKTSRRYTTRFSLFPNFKVTTKLYMNSVFPYTVNEWNNLDNIIKSSESFLMFRRRMLNLIRPKCNETYRIQNSTGLKLLTRLRIGLSHLNHHQFNHSFRDFINPLCSCSLSVEKNVHFLLNQLIKIPLMRLIVI